jgi:hypothetical protein
MELILPVEFEVNSMHMGTYFLLNNLKTVCLLDKPRAWYTGTCTLSLLIFRSHGKGLFYSVHRKIFIFQDHQLNKYLIK